MAKNIVEKIISAHLVEGEYKAGERIGLRIDQTLTQDATGTMACLELEAMGVEQVKTELSVSYVDHNMLQNGPENNNDHLYLQSVAYNKGIYFSRPGNGICHQVHLERFGAPGKTLLGADSHTPTGGGIGMMAMGAGGIDVALAMAGKPFYITVPTVIGVKLTGKLRNWVAAKDVILQLLSVLTTKGNVGSIVEYFGEGVDSLSVPERATITNMGAELGVTTSIFPSDQETLQFLNAQERGSSWIELSADAGAEYDRIIEMDLSTLEPMAACPSSPDNIKTIESLNDLKVDQIIIGSCTNSSLKDLMLVAKALKGKTVNAQVSAAIAPGSRQVLRMLAENGGLADLIAAGVRILESGCGPCIGQGTSPANGSVSVRTFNRNFAGRTGTVGDQAYLVSPETAIAAILTGKLTSPLKLNLDYPTWTAPEKFTIDDSLILAPANVCANEGADNAGIIRKETIGDPPQSDKLPTDIDGAIIIKVGDKITTDHIMPAGVHLKLRSNIPRYSRVVFECFTEAGKASFAERAETSRDKGIHGVIVAADSYGQGSSREHAAICPMYLGIKVVIAKSIERIHSANLINFGILPLFFINNADYDLIEEGAKLVIADAPTQIQAGKEVKVTLTLADGSTQEIVCEHQMSAKDVATVVAGGILNQ